MLQINNALDLVLQKLTRWYEHIVLMLPNFFMALFLLVFTFMVARLIQRGTEKVLRRVSHSVALNNLVTSITYVVVLLIGLFFVLGILNLDKTVTSLLAGIGIVGLALGFAFQDIAANFISGVIIAVRRPFTVGDVIESNDYFGTIERINLRTIDIRQTTGELVKLPNRKVFEAALINFTHYGIRRIDLDVGISYGEDLERVQRVVREAVKGIRGQVEAKDVDVVFHEFGDSSINFKARFWIKYSRQFDYVEAKSEAIIKIKKAFDQNNIVIPFPIRTLDFGIKGGEKLNTHLSDLSKRSPSGNGR
jgi:small conductance mechanosensitive channel